MGTLMKAFLEGWDAGMRGDEPGACPYDSATVEWADRQRGLGFATDYLNTHVDEREWE